jgi:UDP-glucose 4-epimerase
MSSSILVTGGAGFIGSHLVRALLQRGDEVRVLDDYSTGRRQNLADVSLDVQIIEGDVRDPGAVTRALHGADAVLHQAALPSVALSFEDPARVEHVNVGGTAVVMAEARRHGVGRVILASSCAVYGDGTPPLAEDAQPRPLSPYAVGKLAAEGYLRTLSGESGGGGPLTVALRYFNVYGPRQDPGSEYSGVIARFALAAAEGRPCTVYGDGRQTRDFVYVGDVVRANLAALQAEEAAGSVINIGSGAETSLLDLIDGIRRSLGIELQVRHEAPRAGDIVRSRAVIDRARQLLGYEPATTFQDGLAQTLAWYREQDRAPARG